MDFRTVGKQLEAARKAAGLSARKAAEAIGVSHVALRGWEEEKTQPTVTVLGALARIYGVHIDELVGVDSSEVRALPAEWPAGLREFIASELAMKVGLMPREVLMLARAGWAEPAERGEHDWMMLLIGMRHLRGENPATGMMPGDANSSAG